MSSHGFIAERRSRVDQPPKDLQRIAVGVDGSPASLAALKWAADEARRRNVALHVVRIWHYPISSFGFFTDQSFAIVQRDEEEKLDFDVVEVLGDANDLDIYEVALDGPSVSTLVEAIEGAELLVVGSKGHHGLLGVLGGSVSDRVVRISPCPVVVVSPATSHQPPATSHQPPARVDSSQTDQSPRIPEDQVTFDPLNR